MGWRMRGFVSGVVVTIVVLAVAAYLVLRAGLIPAAADRGALPLETWVAKTSLHATLASQSPKGPNPVPLTTANLIEGIHLYRRCAACHGGAPGVTKPSPIALGEYPRPPQLGKDGVEDDPEGVTFWKIKHGLRWTGMPSWKNALNDKQIWTLALFLKHMDKLPPAAETAWRQIGVRRPSPASSPAAPPAALNPTPSTPAPASPAPAPSAAPSSAPTTPAH